MDNAIKTMNRNLLILILIISFSCSNTMNLPQWKIIKAKGIQNENISLSFLSIINYDSAILLGSSYSDNDLLNKRFDEFNAVGYGTFNGGSNWKEIKIGKGRFSAFTRRGDFLVASVVLENDRMESSTIYSSKDLGKTWESVSKIENFFVRDVFLDNKEDIFFIGKNSGSQHWNLFKYSSTKFQWEKLAEIGTDITGIPAVMNNDIFFICRNKSEYSIKEISLATGQVKNLRLINSFFRPFLLSSNNNDLYITGRIGDSTLIQKYGSNDTTSIELFPPIQDRNQFPVGLHFIKNQSILLVGNKNSLGVTYSIYIKKPEKVQWEKIEVPSSIFAPFAFYNNIIWGYSGNNQIYYLKFNE